MGSIIAGGIVILLGVWWILASAQPDLDKVVVIKVADAKTGKVKEFAKREKTWWDRLMEWLPQASVALVLGVVIGAVIW